MFFSYWCNNLRVLSFISYFLSLLMGMSQRKCLEHFFKLRFIRSAFPLFHTKPVILLKKEMHIDL